MATPSPVLLSVENLEVNFGAVRALKGISLDVHAGEVVALVGANGAGKSTTLRTISGLSRPRGGRIIFDGKPIGGVAPSRIVSLGIAQSPEGRRLFGGLTVADNLRLGACTRTDKDAILRDSERMFMLFPILKQRLKQLAGTLSGGEQQQLALARALMAAPRLLLLDEPSLGVAPLLVRHIFSALAELKRQGMTMLLVEQNITLALDLADRAYVLRTGQVALSGRSAELRDSERVAQAYLGAAT
ncbi:ABC transporter ATP-binding protein [Mesorhizobium sp. M7A.F.Ca.CA.001.09.2.1]|uniref:ABC transporter related protein n=1 Tax=Mesorhizobium ciceri biovar biserrulae (strain HAMBI 2942 / LMG 23838 / WSM1271) TaxID=765698 RepID=E8TCK6_MESCW|nr:ABC transporter related protein [Mesorhizobium ciceri biovar biserrulae WSM1271]RUU21083.1 ABC transporter ATP-binding protein [Mesorhizobium sp. Primo-B]RUU39743.1 ABC transporter ATP-binding protein [Mesorhizobium sp. Primo-A]RUX15078.1 ABC transporter ATP-binding protein [Mesorhizobium sp. M7A.F.Ca.CA.002.14.1.2]RUX40386.1 ABC transporter ATP-binding protein [Mesorhizobium sp. M7A.F.Ca.CA.002.11.2.1]RUX52657.1 ABC transporter ATP-binding protein [Mesorhizobium sp. M7A.F.Ca.CA.002.09.1.1]